MGKNTTGIIAGRAYVGYFADKERFKQDNAESKADYKKTVDDMYKMWKYYVDKRFKHEERMEKFRTRAMQRELREQRTFQRDLERIKASHTKWVTENAQRQERERKNRQERERADLRRHNAAMRRDENRVKLGFAREDGRTRRQAASLDADLQRQSLVLSESRRRREEAWAERDRREREAQQRRERQERQRDADRVRQERIRQREFSRNQDRLQAESDRRRRDRERRDRMREEERNSRELERSVARMERERQARRRQREQRYQSALQTVTVGGIYMSDRLWDVSRSMTGAVMDSVRQFGTVESFMLNIRESVRDNTNDIVGDMDRLQKKAYQLGETTEFDAAHVASGMDVLAVNNMAPGDILGAMAPIINLASVFSNERFGRVMPDQAATVVTEVMNAWEMGAGEIPAIVDKMAVAGRQGNISLQNLGDALRYASGMAKETGMSIDQLLAALVVLDRRGQKGEMGGAGLAGIISTILDPPKEARDFLATQGIQFPTSGNLDFLEVLQAFERVTSGMDEVQRGQVIAKAFPNRQMRGFELLMGASGQMSELQTRFSTSQGQGEQLASAKRQGINFLLDVFDSALQTLKAEFGESLKDEVGAIFKAMAEAISWMAQTLDAHPNIGKALGAIAASLIALASVATVGFRGTAMVTGMMAWTRAFGVLVRMAPALGSAFAGLAAVMTGPVGIAVAVVALAGMLDYYFNDGRIFSSIYRAVENLYNWITGRNEVSGKIATETSKYTGEGPLRTVVNGVEQPRVKANGDQPVIRLGRNAGPMKWQDTPLQAELRKNANQGRLADGLGAVFSARNRKSMVSAGASAAGADLSVDLSDESESDSKSKKKSDNPQFQEALNRMGDFELKSRAGTDFVMSLFQSKQDKTPEQMLKLAQAQVTATQQVAKNTAPLKDRQKVVVIK